MKRLCASVLFILCLAGAGMAHAQPPPPQYYWFDTPTGCTYEDACRVSHETESLVGYLYSLDYPQDETNQGYLWDGFKRAYPGITDADRRGNMTATYNCHSYIYRGGDGWLNGDALQPYFFGSESGCWDYDEAGTSATNSSSDHSFRNIGDFVLLGKCGAGFLCTGNEYVYPNLFGPSTIWVTKN